MTVLFADLTESVRRTADLSPEEATGLVNPLLEAMVELIVRYDGRIDRFLGDGVLAVFGVPIAHEDDPIRAVRAAMELRERAEAMSLAVTAGVNTGRVYFGPVGSSLHEELTVMGPTVNLAARLQSQAAAGEIMIGESTRAHVEKAFALVPTTLSIKGITGPVTAYRAEYQVDHPEKVRGIEGLTAAMVGRESELAQLVGALDGNQGSVALVGPAGVGKSRLAAELNRHAAEKGFDWLEGRGREDTIHVPYAPTIEVFRRRYGTEETSRSVLGELDGLVAKGAVDPDVAHDIAPFLTTLLGGGVDPDMEQRVSDADPDQRRHLTVTAAVAMLEGLARERPTVLFLDDLHWSDEASMEVVEKLNRSQTGGPVTVIAYRPDPDTHSAGLEDRLCDGHVTLRLNVLSAEESIILIRRLLDVSGIPVALETRIVDNSGGNPFYVEEILRTFIQRKVILRRDGGWEAVGDLDQIPVPESVEGLVMSRFDRLPSPVKRASRVASVLGGEFSSSLLGEIDQSLPVHLPMMTAAGLTARLRAGDDPEYSFVHALTRQAIYASLLPSHRSELHGLAGAALERSGSDDLEQLAHHYSESANHAKAVESLLAAAERAVDAYANDTARRHLEMGFGRIEGLPPDAQPRWKARYRACRGELRERSADHEGAQADLEAALAEFEADPFEEARLLTLLGRTHRLQGDFKGSHDCYDRAEIALDALEDPDSPDGRRAWIQIQQERSHALYFGGRGRELPAHNARLEPIVETHGTVAQRVDLRRAMAMDAFVRHRFLLDEEAVAAGRHTVELARGSTDPGRIAESNFVLGFTLLWADQIEEAVPVLGGAIQDASRVGDVVHELRARSYHAVAVRRAGRTDEAETAARMALDLAGSLGDTYYEGHALATLCWVGWKRGDGTCRLQADAAHQAWGETVVADDSGLETEFAWMTAWPLAAEAFARSDLDSAIGALAPVTVPWERHMPEDLDRAVRRAMGEKKPDLVETALQLARVHRLI